MPTHCPKRPAAHPNDSLAMGRFAPSPTGQLHLGSLTTALASYCHIKSIQGHWLVRIEDTDRQRCRPEFSAQILRDLEHLGLYWDDEVFYQSRRESIYNELLYDGLSNRLYGCGCSRKQLAEYPIYPGFCRPEPSAKYTPSATSTPDTQPKLNSELNTDNAYQQRIADFTQRKVRVQLPNYSIGFLDGIQGMQWANPQQTLGDVVLRRADGTINYFLAASVDDGLQGITHVMRGLDILPLTPAQIAIMSYLNLPMVEHWYHLPLVENQHGQKLSKQNLAEPIDTSSTKKCQQLILQALNLLKQDKVELDSPELMLKQAVQQWQNKPLQQQRVLGTV
ncbi:tRNA glutamyl-Q(34) synthetase GluQRS [Psychrobacter sp. FDAARGOS_221]|uniref:tRNA glutamyl-Q(34) synthetase GluQRS n=1 Tax=Psychrobacter sp. FDAARGOS_221 TaxID=1975705 RepID=UPI000BB59451|nr:tRNA glutamyl-Q(34) synthetase GluQRS [Psychrobacter sp. FDAARGOS_221]PNK60555.1 tRNA glutamyl-Q(34) synthetase GluQRS [Psychrobacter sp. FDAARGOS_221]